MSMFNLALTDQPRRSPLRRSSVGIDRLPAVATEM
jgi:hypothetical protein